MAVLTNSTLLSRKNVRKELAASDLVVPSLDAVSEDMFAKINRPHSSLKIEELLLGLQRFRQEFNGLIWLEIMLVRGINDFPSHIRNLKEAITKIKPDKVQLNEIGRAHV